MAADRGKGRGPFLNWVCTQQKQCHSCHGGGSPAGVLSYLGKGDSPLQSFTCEDGICPAPHLTTISPLAILSQIRERNKLRRSHEVHSPGDRATRRVRQPQCYRTDLFATHLPQLTQGSFTIFSLIPCIHHVHLSKRSKAPQVVKDMMWKTHGKYPDQGRV